MTRGTHAGISDQRKASIHRLEDARALFEKKRWRGSMYLAGYAVECRLKAQLMKKWRCYTLNELEGRLMERGISSNPFKHNLDLLLGTLGSKERARQNRAVWESFARVNDWRPSWRYSPSLANREEAEDFLLAATNVVA